tara:strand:- start:733 stop:1794 length:1062 start_codon:yes stop_codon:yes gene_type:complete
MTKKKSIEDFVLPSVAVIINASPNAKVSTINTYTRLLRKLYNKIEETLPEPNYYNKSSPIPNAIYKPDDIISLLNKTEWGQTLKDVSRKNYISLILTMLRGLKENDNKINKLYDDYRTYFDILKGGLDAEQIKQKPSDKELDLKGLSIESLRKSLSFHSNKVRQKESNDISSAMYNMMGHLHLDEALRNEACDMVLSSAYIPVIDDPNVNFIWVKGRNMKLMVIRNNKVRNPARGDEPKEVWIKGSLNTAINKYIQVLKNSGEIENEKEMTVPLIHSKGFKLLKHITSSHYSQLFKNIWAHIDLELTTTMIRKVYAMSVRDKYKGNLIKEKEACEKLDHSKDTHDKHYILNFD